MRGHWVITVHEPGGDALVLGVYRSEKSAEAKAVAVKREAAKRIVDIDTEIRWLHGANTSAEKLLNAILGTAT